MSRSTPEGAPRPPAEPRPEAWPEQVPATRRERLEVLLHWLLFIAGFLVLIALGTLI